jgi:acetyl esterase/lipase
VTPRGAAAGRERREGHHRQDVPHREPGDRPCVAGEAGAAAGSPSELHVYPGAPHNFVAMPCRAAEDAHAKAVAIIRRHLDA